MKCEHHWRQILINFCQNCDLVSHATSEQMNDAIVAAAELELINALRVWYKDNASTAQQQMFTKAVHAYMSRYFEGDTQ